jgi:hypothetical protein
MRIEHVLSEVGLDIVVTGDNTVDESYRLVDIESIVGDKFTWKVLPTSDMPAGLNVTKHVARVSWQLNSNVRITTPKAPRWKSFILQAEYGGLTARAQINIVKDLAGSTPLGTYFQLADPSQWTSPKGQRALSLLQAILDDYGWNTPSPLPARAWVLLVNDPRVNGVPASYFNHDAKGNPIIVLGINVVRDLQLTPPLTVTDDDRFFADIFLHELGHAIMSFKCGPYDITEKHKWLTELRQVTGNLRSSILGAPFSIIPGAVDWGYQWFNGLWGKDRYDFMSEWCRASGWMIDEPEKGLGWLGWKMEPPNIYLAGDIGKHFNLRNIRIAEKRRRRLVYLNDRGYELAEKLLEKLKRATPPNMAAIAKQQKVVDDQRAEGQQLQKDGGFISEYAATNPDEDWAECVSLPFARGTKITDSARRKFLAEQGLPARTSPAKLDKWLGVTVRPLTQLNEDDTITYPPKFGKKSRTKVDSARAGSERDDDGDGDGDKFQDYWQECLEAVNEFQAAVKSVTGDTLDNVIDTLRNIEAFEHWDRPFSGLQVAVTHGTGLVPVVDAQIAAGEGDLLFCKGNSVYLVAAVNADGLPERLVGSGAEFKSGLPETLPTLDPERVKYRWTPAAERRVCVATAEGENPFEIPLNNWLLEALQWWGLDLVTVGQQEVSVSTGPSFALAWLKVCEQDVRLTSDPSHEQIERCLANIGARAVEWTGDKSNLLQGDLVAISKPDTFGIIVSIDETQDVIEVLIGGDSRKGPFGEPPGAVRHLVTSDLPIQRIWRVEWLL